MGRNGEARKPPGNTGCLSPFGLVVTKCYELGLMTEMYFIVLAGWFLLVRAGSWLVG